ncbi:hypothetical protein [Planococcus rifietoensis]|uniref:hypothetical protein n=1 Tax=Planococcus rifietoensis TaxID=200991 RepID=UPI00384EA857
MNKVVSKSLKSAFISTSPLLVYIVALIIAPEATEKYVGIFSSFIFGISQGDLIKAILFLGVLLTVLAFYDLYWKIHRNRKKIIRAMPFEEIPTGKVFEQLYADIDKEVRFNTSRLAEALVDPKETKKIDLKHTKTMLELVIGLREKDSEILEELNAYCKNRYLKNS